MTRNNIKDRDLKQPGYAVFNKDSDNRGQVFATYGKTTEIFDSVNTGGTARASSFAPLLQPVTDINVRQEFGRGDYDQYRPTEHVPTKFRDIVLFARSVYQRVGIVRNVIDLMTDFAADNVKFLHPDKNEQAFYQAWAQKTKLNETINQFARHLLVDHNVVVKRITAKITKPVETEILQQFALAEPDIKIQVTKDQFQSREIPWRFQFLDVTNLTWVGGNAGLLSGQRTLTYRLPQNIISLIRKEADLTPSERNIVNNLPKDMIDGIRAGKNIIQLDPEKVHVSHCKKDDWDVWSVPFLFSIMPDIMFKDKLRQADVSALDGVINVIRIWKLGDHTEGILPSSAAVSKLINILEANTGGGAMDIVWDSMIDMKDYYPPIDKILGSEKYDQVNRDILIGLGIPEVLLGGKGSNFSNSFIQLKTIVERLKYIRSKITEWLTEEVALIAKSMGFETLPKIFFNQMNMSDENVEKQLIVGLLDRGIISPEGVLEAYGKNFDIELERNIEQRRAFEKNKLDIVGPFAKPETAPGGAGPTGGRPPATKDVHRKERKPKIRTAEDLTVMARDVIDIFDDVVVPTYMEKHDIDNARQLTADDKRLINNLRLHVLACISEMDDISEDIVVACLSKDKQPNASTLSYIQKAISDFTSSKGKEPTMNQRKTLEAAAWAAAKLES